MAACSSTPENPAATADAAEVSYFDAFRRAAFFHSLGEGLQEQDEQVKLHAETVRRGGACPPLRITVDGDEVDFPYVYASLDGDDGSMKFSLFDGELVSCNGVRLPTTGRNSGLISFREAYASDDNWTAPDSVVVEEVELDYLPRQQRFRSLSWRGGSIQFHEEPPEAQPVLLSDSASGDTVEVCLPPLRVENTFWKGKDDLRANRTTMTLEGTLRATTCGPRISNTAWHAGDLECDPYSAQEAGSPIDLDLFVDPEQEFGIIGFRREAGVTCESVRVQDTPFFSTKVLFEASDDPDVGIANTVTTDNGADVSNGFFGNSISPFGPREEGKMCLHRPLYWYSEGRTGFVRGSLVPHRCPTEDKPG
ncbi:MAG: hypothetical protein AAGA54_27505 [Myxococcota bacterium]